jgi:serine/threonine-protein kinase RsbW
MPLKKIAQLVIPSSLDHLSDLDRFTEKTIRTLSLPGQMLDDIAITASEAVNNAIVHGNKLDPSKNVKITFYRGDKFLRLIVQDEGSGFVLESVPDPRNEENLLKTSGRGLLIIRHLMDRVGYRQLKAGLQIIMDKFYPKG